jgi:hypothetical protein
MKTIHTLREETSTKQSFSQSCLMAAQKLVARIEQARDNILAEFRDVVTTHGQLLHQALNEAEALAWQTAYPHLVFPVLAQEKARAVAAWSAHQESILHPASANWPLAA